MNAEWNLIRCILSMGKLARLLIGCLYTWLFPVLALDPKQYAVDVTCQAQSSPPALKLAWPAVDYARQYWVRRKSPADAGWGAPLANLPGNATGYVDSQVSAGNVYEYEIQMETAAPAYEGGFISAYSYICGGIEAPLADSKGKVLVLVDSAVETQLEPELSGFVSDLVGAGYTVVRRSADRSASPPDVKNIIRSEYNADPGQFRSIVLVGHIPVPYSGYIAPDLHDSHRGAWPADVYYADMDGTWTDSTVSFPGGADYPEESNYPGDGKFDQSEIPAPVRLELGRIDFYDLPAFAPRTETDLLKAYFRKDHAFRHRLFTASRRALMHDNFGEQDGDAPAVDAWRHFSGFFGPGNIREVGPYNFFPVLASESFLWSYGCGGGEMTQADGIGSTTDFVTTDPQTVFVILHGSYFGDWNFTDNFLRSALGSPSMTLASIWSGIPHWYFHHMALGASIGYSTRISQNNRNTYKSYKNFYPGGVHIALMGDPTLEMFPVVPPSNLVAANGSSVQLSWSPSSDSGLVGYHVYYSSSPSGPFTRITSSPVSSTRFSHSAGPGTWYYMVRAVKLETTGSGTFYNASQGVFASVNKTDTGGSPPPAVTLSVIDPGASELGPDSGAFQVTRSPAGANPLTVNLLWGGTAVNGVDYQTVPASVVIPAGAASATITITPLADSLVEGDETVTVQLGLSPDYTSGGSPSAVLIIKDNPPNRPPVISGIPDQSVQPGAATGDIPFTVSDPETASDALTVRAESSDPAVLPASGIVLGGSGGNRTIRLSPSAGASGSVRVTITVSDGALESSATFLLTIRPNQPPQVADQRISTLEDTPRLIQLAGTDPDGQPLQFSIKTQPRLGTLSGSPPNVVYTPAANINGTDSFTFAASDGLIESAPATVTIEIIPVNDPPVALSANIRLPKNGSTNIILSAQDVDNNSFTFQITQPPSHGSVSLQGSNAVYQPALNYTGPDFFRFTASDGNATSAPATVNIVVDPKNFPPAAQSTNISLLEDQTAVFRLSAQDPDGDALRWTIVSQPAHGQLTGTPPDLVYRPATNFNGTDSFTFKVSDGQLESGLARVDLQIAPVNDPPVAGDLRVSVVEDTPVSITLPANDVDGDALAYAIVTQPVKGRLTGAAPNLIYTPLPDANGTDSFTWKASDGLAESRLATVSLEITPVNDPPAISAIPSQAVAKNRVIGPLPFTVTDVENSADTLNVTASFSNPGLIQLDGFELSGTGENRFVTIRPVRNATGSATVAIRVTDGEKTTETSFTVTVTNRPPIAETVDVYASGQRTFTVADLLANALEPDGDPLTLSAVGTNSTTHGVLSAGSDTFTYVPNAGFSGTDSFSYSVQDDSGATASGIVRIHIGPAARITGFTVQNARVTLAISGPPGALFRVEASDNVINWTSLGNGSTDGNGNAVFQDLENGARMKLYRVVWP